MKGRNWEGAEKEVWLKMSMSLLISEWNRIWKLTMIIHNEWYSNLFTARKIDCLRTCDFDTAAHFSMLLHLMRYKTIYMTTCTKKCTWLKISFLSLVQANGWVCLVSGWVCLYLCKTQSCFPLAYQFFNNFSFCSWLIRIQTRFAVQ